jgi:hypothetical protein
MLPRLREAIYKVKMNAPFTAVCWRVTASWAPVDHLAEAERTVGEVRHAFTARTRGDREFIKR